VLRLLCDRGGAAAVALPLRACGSSLKAANFAPNTTVAPHKSFRRRSAAWAEAVELGLCSELVKTRKLGLIPEADTLEYQMSGTGRVLVIFYGVISEGLDGTVPLHASYEEAESIVRAWDEDEPDEAGSLYVEPIELVTGELN
jgi:hypothetical protein